MEESNIMNISNIQWMLDEIENMSLDEHIHMSEIIKNTNLTSESKINFTENENGLFIKMNELPFNTIQSLYEYVAQVKESRNVFENAIRTINQSAEEKIKDKVTDEDEKPNISIDDWKMRVIEKIRNENKMKQRRKRSNISTTTTTAKNEL